MINVRSEFVFWDWLKDKIKPIVSVISIGINIWNHVLLVKSEALVTATVCATTISILLRTAVSKFAPISLNYHNKLQIVTDNA